MAALAHLGVGLATKPFAPEVNVGWLILGNYVLDLLWYAFWAIGVESMATEPYWDHSLVMAVAWSVFFGLLAAWLVRKPGPKRKIGIVFGLMVFAHWVVDWITHPMSAVMPPGTVDQGLPLAFGNTPHVGLGLYRTISAVWVTEIGSVVIGLAIYIMTRRRIRRSKAVAAVV